jgi:hypothetical protein
MPDRPGALGAVASRIGAVRADVIGIEILTRADGRAMDEIVVEIDKELLPLLLSEIAEVDGVVVEDVRTVHDGLRDRRLDAYRTAVALLEARTPDEVLAALAQRVGYELDSAWVAIFDTETKLLLASTGRPPGTDWLTSTYRRNSVPGLAESGLAESGTADLIWAHLAHFDAALCTGRPGWPFTEHDHEQLATMARLADARWSDLKLPR